MFGLLVMFLLIMTTAVVDRKDKENSRRDHLRSAARIAVSLVTSLGLLLVFAWFAETIDPANNILSEDGVPAIYFAFIFIAPIFIYLGFRKIIK